MGTKNTDRPQLSIFAGHNSHIFKTDVHLFIAKHTN